MRSILDLSGDLTQFRGCGVGVPTTLPPPMENSEIFALIISQTKLKTQNIIVSLPSAHRVSSFLQQYFTDNQPNFINSPNKFGKE